VQASSPLSWGFSVASALRRCLGKPHLQLPCSAHPPLSGGALTEDPAASRPSVSHCRPGHREGRARGDQAPDARRASQCVSRPGRAAPLRSRAGPSGPSRFNRGGARKQAGRCAPHRRPPRRSTQAMGRIQPMRRLSLFHFPFYLNNSRNCF
jgi:hypothetical protein